MTSHANELWDVFLKSGKSFLFFLKNQGWICAPAGCQNLSRAASLLERPWGALPVGGLRNIIIMRFGFSVTHIVLASRVGKGCFCEGGSWVKLRSVHARSVSFPIRCFQEDPWKSKGKRWSVGVCGLGRVKETGGHGRPGLANLPF